MTQTTQSAAYKEMCLMAAAYDDFLPVPSANGTTTEVQCIHCSQRYLWNQRRRQCAHWLTHNPDAETHILTL